MKRNTVAIIALGFFAPALALGVARHAQAQDAKTPYPTMLPLDQYLMDRDAEIAMSRSAGPNSVSSGASSGHPSQQGPACFALRSRCTVNPEDGGLPHAKKAGPLGAGQ